MSLWWSLTTKRRWMRLVVIAAIVLWFKVYHTAIFKGPLFPLARPAQTEEIRAISVDPAYLVLYPDLNKTLNKYFIEAERTKYMANFSEGDTETTIHIVTFLNKTMHAKDNHLLHFDAMLKSAILYSDKDIHFHVFANASEINLSIFYVGYTLYSWREAYPQIKYTLYPSPDFDRLNQLFQWSSAIPQRVHEYGFFREDSHFMLLLPWLLPHVDKVIAIHLHCLVVGDLRKLWNEFQLFKPDQMIGYSTDAEHGAETNSKGIVNSFSMLRLALMDLSKMRKINLRSSYVAEIERSPSIQKITDLAMLKKIFKRQSRLYYGLSCNFVYLEQYCLYQSLSTRCPLSEISEISVLQLESYRFGETNIFLQSVLLYKKVDPKWNSPQQFRASYAALFELYKGEPCQQTMAEIVRKTVDF